MISPRFSQQYMLLFPGTGPFSLHSLRYLLFDFLDVKEYKHSILCTNTERYQYVFMFELYPICQSEIQYCDFLDGKEYKLSILCTNTERYQYVFMFELYPICQSDIQYHDSNPTI